MNWPRDSPVCENEPMTKHTVAEAEIELLEMFQVTDITLISFEITVLIEV